MYCIDICLFYFAHVPRNRRGRDRMVVGFITNCAIEVNLIHHYVIKFVSDLWQVGGFLRVLRFERNQRKRGKIDTHNTHRHGRSLSWVCTETSIKSGGVKLVLCEQTSTLILIIMKILSRISIHFIYRYIMKTRILESA
jgi:hypothetical protein